MDRKSGTVKPRRRYDSSRRREHARQTREAILDAAQDGFLRDGYGTTITAIAGDAGVSVDTVYKAFGGKPGLVRAIYERALAGQGTTHAEARSDALQTTSPDPREIARGLGRLTTEVAPLVAPILLLVRDAAGTDPAMRQLQADLDDQRLERMTHNAENMARAGHLRPDLSVEDAGAIMWCFTSAALYEMLVLRQGWAVERFGELTTAALEAAVLAPSTRQPTRRKRTEAPGPDDQ